METGIAAKKKALNGLVIENEDTDVEVTEFGSLPGMKDSSKVGGKVRSDSFNKSSRRVIKSGNNPSPSINSQIWPN